MTILQVDREDRNNEFLTNGAEGQTRPGDEGVGRRRFSIRRPIPSILKHPGQETTMFLRIDKLQIELPQPTRQDPNSAAAVQELMGGRFGEMSTLMNYMTQSFNFRGRNRLKPYYRSEEHTSELQSLMRIS